MIKLHIPSRGDLHIFHLVLDFNGTLAYDGKLLPEVGELLEKIGEKVEIHVVTADTFSTAKKELADLPCTVHVLLDKDQDQGKKEYIKRLQGDVVACGNGYNDILMVEEADIGIAVMQGECAAAKLLQVADIVGTHIKDVLGLLINPHHMIATLRN